MQTQRRHFVLGATGALAAVATCRLPGLDAAALARSDRRLPGYADWKRAASVIVHSDNTIETRRAAFGTSGITAADELYVRNNLAPPSGALADPDGWPLAVEGVNRPRTLTVRELKQLGRETVAAVLQCSGNGRAFFSHRASGTQWSVGAAGNLLWSGVPLRAVADATGGLAPGRAFVTATGGEDLPAGVDPKSVVVERSVPVAAMERAILAWEMNGEPIPLAHGGPLRLVVPGYYGVNNVKYVKRLAFTERESDARIQRVGYRVRPVGVDGAPSQPSMWRMSVKSWISHPLTDRGSGRTQIHGVAFGGDEALGRVEVSLDGGRTWREARLLGPDLGRFAWRPFVLAADLSPGTYEIASRASDARGERQPEAFEPNERGYGHNGWRAHAVTVTVT